MFQNDFVIERSVVGTVMDGLSQLKGVQNISQFAVRLANGLGSNLKKPTKDAFFNEVKFLATFSFSNYYCCFKKKHTRVRFTFLFFII